MIDPSLKSWIEVKKESDFPVQNIPFGIFRTPGTNARAATRIGNTVIDLYSRKVVGWSYSARMTRDLVCDALDAAIAKRRPGPGLVFHSDRGSQYASQAFRRRLWRHRILQSMSGKGNCYDNAVAESFFATLKKELVRSNVYRTRQHARDAIFQYIEVFYNRRRLHSTLGYMTPQQFESCKATKRVA